jgi:hypothetical protein
MQFVGNKLLTYVCCTENVYYGDRKAHVMYLDFGVNSVGPQLFVLLMLLNTFVTIKLGTVMQKDFSQTCLFIFMELWIPYIKSLFGIHMSVHRNIITNYSQQDTTFSRSLYFYKLLFIFQAVPLRRYNFRYCQSILLLAASGSIGWHDGRRNRLKHVEHP